MNNQVIRLAVADYDELIAFSNRAFGKIQERRFEQILPALYQPTERRMKCNYAIRQNGAMMANVGLFPITWHIGGETLRIGGIGGVAVAPECRGQGLMQKILTHLVELMPQEEFALSYLGGQRQRYRYFGWEVAGVLPRAEVRADNLRHHFSADAQCPITLQPLSNDPQEIATLHRMYERQFSHCERPADQFVHFLRSWGNRSMVGRDRGGKIVGYVIVHYAGKSLFELTADDPQMALQIIRAAMKEAMEPSIMIDLDSVSSPIRHAIGAMAERVSLHPSGNWQIFDWPAVVGALLKARCSMGSLPHGSVVIGVENQAKAFRLSVDSKGAACETTQEKPDLQAEATLLTRILFGPLPPSMVMDLPAAAILEAWCPLPLAVPHQDHV